MVAAASLLHALKVGVEPGLRLPRGAVDALEHGVALVAAPVGAGHVQQLDGRYLASGLHVAAPAQVQEAPVAAGGDPLSLGQVVDDLLLEGLVREEPLGLLAGHFAQLKGQVHADALAHYGLNRLHVLRREGPGRLEVVVEPLVDGRTDGVLGLREEFQHGVGHHMRGGVTDLVAAVIQLLLFGSELLLRHGSPRASGTRGCGCRISSWHDSRAAQRGRQEAS